MIRLENIHLSYHKPLITNGRIELPSSSITAIIGKSGLGKTTLLNQIGFIDEKWYEHVDYYLNNEKLNGKNVLELYRNNYFYLFQNNNLIDEMSCFDNIIFLATMRGIKITKEEIFNIFEKLQVDIDLTQYPTQISGGQRQKLEIAILAVIQPKIVLCDEITSALDEVSAIEIFTLLKKIIHEIHAVGVMVVHDPKIIDQCDQIVEIKDEKLVVNKPYSNQELVELQPTKSISIKTYFTYAVLKLMNPKYLKQSLVVGLLFSIMIASFNLIYRYNKDNQLKLQDSLLHVDTQEFIFDHIEGFELGTPLYQLEKKIDQTSVQLFIGNSNEELSKHILTTIQDQGVYINVLYADLLGITTNEQSTTITIDEVEYPIAGIVDNNYFMASEYYCVYLCEVDNQLTVNQTPKYSMYYESDLTQLANIEKQITDHHATIYSDLKEYSNHLKQNDQINLFIDLLLYAVIVILIVFAIIYSIIQYEAKKKEITLLYNRGFRLSSLSFLNFSENLGVLLIILVVSPIITQIISNQLINSQIFYTKDNQLFHYMYISLLTALLVLGVSQFMISKIYMSIRKKGKING